MALLLNILDDCNRSLVERKIWLKIKVAGAELMRYAIRVKNSTTPSRIP